MPTYCYSTQDGETHERFYLMGKAPDKIRIKGKTAKRDFHAEGVKVPPTKGWPIECYASGVHADQAQDLRDHFKKHGVNCHVNSDGNPIYENAAQQRKALKCRGMHNRDDNS